VYDPLKGECSFDEILINYLLLTSQLFQMTHINRTLFFVLMISMHACGQSGESLEGTASTEATPFSALAPAQFSDRMKSDSQVVVVDVRTADECNEGIIPGALMVDFYQEEKMKQAMANWNPSHTYLVYCRSGGRSGQTLELMKASGFKNAYHLEGGMNAWIRAGRPVVSP